MPELTVESLLAVLRAGGAAAETALSALAGDTDLRAGATSLLVSSLLPTDRMIACRLLEQEIAAHEVAGHGATETLYSLAAAVARYADPDDALLLWRARQATPETRAGMDVEQLARAGFERVRRRLTTLARSSGPTANQARQALEWLESGAATGAMDDLPGYFAWADERFGLHTSGPT